MLARMLSVLSRLDGALLHALQLTLLFAGFLLLWRLWRFTLMPILKPNEPKELPYWIPLSSSLRSVVFAKWFLMVASIDSPIAHQAAGHAIPFFKDSEATLRHARVFFGNTREPFTFTVAGQKFYILMSPKDHSTVYKNSTILTFDGFIRDLYATFGMSKDGIHKMWQAQSAKVQDKPIEVHLGQGIHREQLHPGSHLEDLTVVYLREIEQRLRWDRVPDSSSNERPERSVSLYEWCAEVLGNATIQALFGNALLELEPRLLEYFYAFDSESWKLMFQLPPLFAKRMHDAKDRSRAAYISYFQLPPEKRPGTCYYLRAVEEKQRQAGMTDEDIGYAAQMFFWGANANPFKVCFWLLCHILYDSDLLHVIREEVGPSIVDDKVDLDRLLNHSPTLDAAFNETLRVTSVNSSARNIEAPVIIGDKTLSTDGKIMMPYRQLHLEESVFGPDTKTFNHKRFLQNPDLSRNPSFKPFGGGSTYCSGRFIAKREILAFVALAVHRYDFSLENPDRAFPRMDETKPTLGIMDPVPQDLVTFVVSPRR